MSTVNTILKRSVQIADQLELDHTVLVFDLAMYAKAQQIRWKNDDFTQRLVIRLGEFHTTMSYLSVLGKRFGDAGLQDVLIEYEVVAPGSINGVISGHHYNLSMRAHKLLYESLQCIRFISFHHVFYMCIYTFVCLDVVYIVSILYNFKKLHDLINTWVALLIDNNIFSIVDSNNNM